MISPPTTVGVVIPTRNEAAAIAHVLLAMPTWVTVVIVADYRSDDGTPDIARRHGARVIDLARPGYGHACLAAIAALPPVDIITFLDGDAADDLGAMAQIVGPVARGEADLVIGSRVRGKREPGALTPQQVFGNWLACRLIRLFWGAQFTDLGPFRAISRRAYERLGMADQNYGWTVEMQVKAARLPLRCAEVAVDYKRRIGQSKVSGTVSGTVKAGTKILWTIAREALVSGRGR